MAEFIVPTEEEVHANIGEVLGKMRRASEKAGRNPGDTQLLVVSKTWPADTIRSAASYPHAHFGESRVQEALEKVPALPSALHWHFIGHLQKNKIRKILPLCETLHSVDSLDLAQQINRIAEQQGVRPNIYLQVNVAEDGAKFGFSVDQVRSEITALLGLSHLNVLGLMTIPAFAADPEASRPHFKVLRELRGDLEQRTGVSLPGLSMGMSGDYLVAIEEGSSIVRVGTAIFGKRTAGITEPRS